MATATDDRFIHSNRARILIGLIGVVFLGIIVTVWNEEVIDFAGSFSGDGETKTAQQTGIEQAVSANPALAACLDERLDHVAQMKEDGVIGEKQAAAFSQRATSLCNAQNPS